MLNIPAGYKLVPIEPTETMVVCGFESRPDPVFSKPEDWEAFAALTGCQQAAHKARLCYAAMLDAAPTPPSVAPGDAQDERIALDRLADYIADNWPDKKYGLEEICQRLNATWPGAFMPAAPAAGDALDAARYRELRNNVWVAGSEFRVMDPKLRYVAPRADVELDAFIDAVIATRRKGEA